MMTTPLQQRIDEFLVQLSSQVPAEVLKQLLVPVEQLTASHAVQQAPGEGEQAPDFTLPDALGQAVVLSHLLKQGPVVLTFYRGEWCPFCNLTLRAYQQALPQFQEQGASLVAISPQTPDHSLSTIEVKKLTFPVLSDVGNQVARQYGLVYAIDEPVRAAHIQTGADLPLYNGDDSWELPMAGTFLVDQSGKVVLAFVDPNFTRRLDPSIIIARLKELRS